jgi:hypothetical protein
MRGNTPQNIPSNGAAIKIKWAFHLIAPYISKFAVGCGLRTTFQSRGF